MPWNEFLLPILAGYIFINVFYLTKFRAQRHDGYRLLIESLMFGAFIFALARLGVIWIHKTSLGASIEALIQRDGLTYPLAGTAILAIATAVALAFIGNLVIGTGRAKRIILDKHDNGFLKLFHKAATGSRMVSVTLSCKKVYIGYVLSAPNLSPEEQFVGLLPIVSGYRDKDTLRLVTTTNYGPAISSGRVSVEDFEVTFSLASIEVASIFEPSAYPMFGEQPGESANQPRSPVSSPLLAVAPSSQPQSNPPPR